MQCDIRQATQADLDGIIACAMQAYGVYVESMGKQPAPMSADYAEQIALSHVYVAEQGDTLAGFVVCYPQQHEMHLENVAVLPAQAGQGTGSQLIAFVEKKATTSGMLAVNLYTNEVMTENIKWYQKIGYQEIERRQDMGFERVFFRKSLVV